MQPLATSDDMAARIPGGIPDDQIDRAESLLLDASAYVRNYTRQTITRVVGDVATLESTPDQWLYLPERPVVGITSVVAGGATLAPGLWFVQNDALFRVDGWNSRFYGAAQPWNQPDTIIVTYDHGFMTVPDDIVAVVCKIAKATWRNPQGLRQWRQGQSEATYAIETVADGALDADDKRVLNFYRRARRSVKLSAGIL